MANDKLIEIEVVYATPHHACVIPVSVPVGTTLRQGIESSGILEQFPEIDLTQNKVGLFSKIKSLDDRLNNSVRIEIYRTLKDDPKDARRKRAAKAN